MNICLPQATVDEAIHHFAWNYTIYGTEEDDTKHLPLGVLTTNHNHGFVCKWFKDNNIVGSGQNHCLHRTNEEGKYWVENQLFTKL